jgi:hypothetical protein
VVYAIKPIIRSESVRDHVDILLAMKTTPIVVVSDLAPMIAAHGEKRQPGMFWPHSGRLAEPNTANLEAAKAGELICIIEGLEDNHIRDGLARYSLADKFHENNMSRKDDLLRKIHLFPQLAGSVNSQCMEQLFRQLGKDAYYLTQMTPAHYCFVLRLNVHMHNVATNKKVLGSVEKSANESTLKCQVTQESNVMTVQPMVSNNRVCVEVWQSIFFSM